MTTLLKVLMLTSFLPLRSTLQTQIVCCASTIELQRAYELFCRPNDVVLELGSHFSQATATLCQSTRHACLVDIKRQSNQVKSGRTTHRDVNRFQSRPDVSIVELQTLVDYKQLLQCGSSNNQSRFDVISMDLGHLVGNDLYLSSLTMAQDILETLRATSSSSSSSSSTSYLPRVLLVKSVSLASLARRLISAPRVLDGHVQLKFGDDSNNENDNDNNHIKKKNSKPPHLLAAVGVPEYRRLVPFTVQTGDAVLEVGCHLGTTTRLLHEAATSSGTCIGVDIGPKIIAQAQQQYPDIFFAVANAWDTLEVLQLRTLFEASHNNNNSPRNNMYSRGYDVVYADIGGLSGAHGTLESLALLDALSRALQPRCIVIKSLCIKRLASQLQSFDTIWNEREKQQHDSTVDNDKAKRT